jgi:hypothetical protein
MSEPAKHIRDEFEVVLIACLAFLAGFLIGAAPLRQGSGGHAPAPTSLPTPAAESAGDQSSANHLDARSAFSARRGSTLSPAWHGRGLNLPSGAAMCGGRIESESVNAAAISRAAAGRESNFLNAGLRAET